MLCTNSRELLQLRTGEHWPVTDAPWFQRSLLNQAIEREKANAQKLRSFGSGIEQFFRCHSCHVPFPLALGRVCSRRALCLRECFVSGAVRIPLQTRAPFQVMAYSQMWGAERLLRVRRGLPAGRSPEVGRNPP